jgi:hypothetical protein
VYVIVERTEKAARGEERKKICALSCECKEKRRRRK